MSHSDTKTCILMSKSIKIHGIHANVTDDKFPMTLIPTTQQWVFGESRNEKTTKYLGRTCPDCVKGLPDLFSQCPNDLNLIYSSEYTLNLNVTTEHNVYNEPSEKCRFKKNLDLSGRWINVNHNEGNRKNGEKLDRDEWRYIPHHCHLDFNQSVSEILSTLHNQ